MSAKNIMTMTNRSVYIKMLLCIVIPAIILFIPQNEILTRNAKWFLALTVWLLMWAAFEITNLLIPSIAYPALMILMQVTTIQTAYSSWLNLIIPALISGFIISVALDECGLLKRICYWIVKRCEGSFKKTMYALYFGCLAVSIVTFCNAELIIAAFCFGLCKAFDLKKTREAIVIFMVGMVAASTCRGFLYYPLFYATMTGATAVVDPSFNITSMGLLKCNWLILIYSLLLITLIMAGSKKSGLGAVISDKGAEYFKAEYAALGKMSKTEKKAAVLTIMLIVLVVGLPSLGINNMFGFLIVGVLMTIPGIDLANDDTLKGIPIGTIFFVASCMAIGAVCGEVGLTGHLTNFLAALLGGMNIVGTLFVILFFGILANFAMTPLSMLAAFSAPLLTLANTLGIAPEAILYTFAFSCDMVFLPYEFVTYLVFFSFGMVSTGQFLKYHTIKNVLFIIFFGVCIIPYWMLIGLI